MNENIITGALVGLGALCFDVWGFVQAYNATKATPQKEKFSWSKAAITVIPSIIAGFLAGYNLTPSSVLDYVSLLTSGFGVAAAQGRMGINSFFDDEVTA
jgi:hypothetical protein